MKRGKHFLTFICGLLNYLILRNRSDYFILQACLNISLERRDKWRLNELSKKFLLSKRQRQKESNDFHYSNSEKYQKDRKMIKITYTIKKTNHQSNWLTMTRISLPSRLAFLTSL